jgi:hypothetical protein
MQNFSIRDGLRVKISTRRLILIIPVAYIMVICSINETAAQAPYLNSKVAAVDMDNNATSSVFCNEGDGMISGGYSLSFPTRQSAFDTMVYSNHPTQEINQTGYFEGWESGLVNMGNATVKITSEVLCLNLTLTP